LNPPLGPLTGGQTVTVTGFDFGTDTTLSFGSRLITVLSQTPTSLTFVTPSVGAAEIDQVQATDPLGMSATLPYTYIGLANYTPLSPYRILDTRHNGHPVPSGRAPSIHFR
jgi:hypothetical protein